MSTQEQRERFEAALRPRMSKLLGPHCMAFRDGDYAYLEVSVAWLAWQAAEAAAIERAWEAVHAEHLEDPIDSAGDIAYELAISDCEKAIRAMLKSNEAKS